MVSLTLFTYIVNLLALSIAIWLGFYVITYSPRRLISWLTGFTLWSISGIFINMLLAITPPPPPEMIENWQRIFFPFWSPEVFQSGVGGWLSGWLATPAIAFWHHISVLLRKENPNKWFKLQIFVVYLLAGVTIYAQLNSSLMFSEASGDPHLLNYLKPGSYYILFMSLFCVIAAICANNLYQAAKSTPSPVIRSQMRTLLLATCLAGITGPVSLIALFDQISIPRVINTILLSATILLIGASISRYSALIEGRIIRRDFIYNAIVTSTILMIYMAITWLAVHLFNIPRFAYIYVLMLAIASHSLVDITRRTLGRILLRKDEDQLRSDLYKLSRSETEKLEVTMQNMLGSVCGAIRATNGVLFLFHEEKITPAAFCNQQPKECPVTISDLLADDIVKLKPEQLPPPLTEASLLVPLYHHTDQIGAIVFGHPVNGIEYPQKDTELILDSSDLIAETIIARNQQSPPTSEAAQMILAMKAPPLETRITPKMVEDLLRNVLDYAYLGRSDFSQLSLVSNQMDGSGTTHIDRGKYVYQILSDVVEKLKPASSMERNPPPREWHPYLILHWAYFEDTLNREIMARLYISEGTFNRTRRAALRSVSRALEELQHAIE